MPDITALIMDDHEWFRREFARLDDAGTADDLTAVWEPLAQRLETHAQAEETIFYPALLKRGDDDSPDETEDAIDDHNKIRDAIAESRKHPAGSHEWYEAVGTARSENSEHLAEEEDEGLPNFRKHASMELRQRLAELWVQFYAAHPGGLGITGADLDPERYVEDNT